MANEHMKRCLASTVRKIQKKITMENKKENHNDITLYTRITKNFKV